MTTPLKVIKYNWKDNAVITSVETEVGTFIRKEELVNKIDNLQNPPSYEELIELIDTL